MNDPKLMHVCNICNICIYEAVQMSVYLFGAFVICLWVPH